MGDWVGGWVGGWADGWMDGWMNGWMDGWVGESVGGWINKCSHQDKIVPWLCCCIVWPSILYPCSSH